MNWGSIVKLSGGFGVLALAVLLPLSGCSAGEPGGEPLSQTSQAYTEASCPNTPNQSFVGLIPDPGVTTPGSYSNSHCYKSYVVQVSNWPAQRAELVIADSGNDDPSWHPNGVSSPAPPSTLSPSACEARFLSVTIYENGVYLKRLAKGGYWNGTSCDLPTMIFSGLKRAYDIIDTVQFTPGNTYTFAGTYRVNDSSSSATLPFKILTPKLLCGLTGQPCCAEQPLVKPFTCEQSNTCVGGTCATCGAPRQICCDIYTSGSFSDCAQFGPCAGGRCPR